MNMNSARENIVIAAELKLRLEKQYRRCLCLGKSAVLGLDSGLTFDHHEVCSLNTFGFTLGIGGETETETEPDAA